MARRLHMDVSVQTGASKVESRGITQSSFMPSTMNALRIHGRGGPEFLKYEDAPIPQFVPGDPLVRVQATGSTPAELGWDENMDGSDRLLSIPGQRVSGAVQTLSTGVTDLRDGDEDYGLADFPGDGAAAEFAAIRASNLALKPKSVDHAGAPAASLSDLTSWQAHLLTEIFRRDKTCWCMEPPAAWASLPSSLPVGAALVSPQLRIPEMQISYVNWAFKKSATTKAEDLRNTFVIRTSSSAPSAVGCRTARGGLSEKGAFSSF